MEMDSARKAAKTDLNNLATKEDLLATKDEIRNIRDKMATKEDLAHIRDTISSVRNEFQERIAMVTHAESPEVPLAGSAPDELSVATGSQPVRFSDTRAYLFFLLTAAVLFAPFFIQGRALLGNADNLFCFYPNLIWGHQSLRSGDFGLWNPLLFAGMDTSGSMHFHMLNPVNWVLLLAPSSWVLEAITLKALCEISLIGFFVFLTTANLVRERLTAVACGLAFQFSGFVWYTVGMYYSLNMLLATVAYIYILLTHERREILWNYFFLSICFAAIMFSGHPAYIIAFLLPAPLLAAILGWNFSGWSRVRLLGITAVSGATAVTLAGVRVLSVVQKVAQTSRAAGFMPAPSLDTVPGNNGALILPGLVPGIWGLDIHGGFNILRWLKAESNLQFAALAHFSVLPILLIFLGVSGRLGRAAFIASGTAAMLAFTYGGFIPMSYELVWSVLRPMHPIVFKVFCALVGGTAVILACRHLERAAPGTDLTRIPLAISFILVAACLQMWTKCVYNVPLQALEPDRLVLGKLLRLLTAGALLCAGATPLVGKRVSLRSVSNAAVSVFALVAACVGVFYSRNNLFTTSPLTLQSLVYMTAAVGCAAVTISALRRWRVHEGDRKAWKTLVPVLIVAVTAVSVPIPEYSGDPTESVVFAGAMLSLARFLAVAVLGVELLSFVQRSGWHPILPFTLVFLFSDAILLSRAYENFGYKGFERPGEMYMPRAFATAEALNRQAGQNLLQNEPLRLAPQGVENWTMGGAGGARVRADTLEPGAVIVTGVRDTTFFQNVPLPPNTHHVVFGAWVRSKDPRVAIGLTAQQADADPTGTSLFHHSGDGQWEWLEGSLHSRLGMSEARPHLFVFDREGEILGPVLAIGDWVAPSRRPKDVSAAILAKVWSSREKPDLTQFRVNYPQVRFGYPAELFANIAMIYGIPTYGGVDSALDPELERLLRAFVPDPALVPTFGVQSAIAEPRILDLLGVRYDFRSTGVRPNALPRVSIFSGAEAAAGFDAQLARLKDPSFNYTTTLVVDPFPDGQTAIPDTAERFIPTPYTQVSNSHVHIKTTVSRPSMLLFNDSFSLDWHAYRNGRSIPVLRANAHFMAVSLPPGTSETDFRFEPARFYLLAKVSIAAACLLALAAIWRLAQSWVRSRTLTEVS